MDLTTSAGQELLASLPDYDPAQTFKLSEQLRREGHSPELVSKVLTQLRLREKAKAKFGSEAQRMLLTDAGLQQASRFEIAQLHAARFVRAGATNLLDLTCGIGGDALAFAQAGLAVTACEIDPDTAAFAAYNLEPYPNATVLNEDSLTVPLTSFDAVFADPARRTARGRTFNPDDYTPPLSTVLGLGEEIPSLGVKVAPGIPYEALPANSETQWISVDGQVLEAGIWLGLVAENPGRNALVIRGEKVGAIKGSDVANEPVTYMTPRSLGSYIYEPDGAVIRSGALGTLGKELQAAPVSEGIAYLSGDQEHHTIFATAFEVVDVVSLKQVKSYLRARDVGRLEVLKRGIDVDPDRFRKSMSLKGTSSATVILTRLMGKHSALIVRRLHAR